METYHQETFSKPESALLAKYNTNISTPVFGLVNLPETTKAALFARYSRTGKSLRRILLDEFVQDDSVISQGEDLNQAHVGEEQAKALFSRVLAEYGDDSVAQLAGVHLACEQASQLLIKAIEWGRLMAYLEQSTRYVSYSSKLGEHYRYYRDQAVIASKYGPLYLEAMDNLFDTYTSLQEPVQKYLDQTLPQEVDTQARKRAIRALSFDILRGLLPAGTLSNMGIFASPQAYEQLVLRLRSHPLPEAQKYAELITTELKKIIPDFLTRLDRAERGGVWKDYLQETQQGLKKAAMSLAKQSNQKADQKVILTEFDSQGEDKIITAALWPYAQMSQAELSDLVQNLTSEEKQAIFATAVGNRLNRRHKPDRSFEHCLYTFEIVSDYGAFRDLQRHRMLTIQWQPLSPALGYNIPAEIRLMGKASQWQDAVEKAENVYQQMQADFPEQAAYLVTLGHNIRYIIKMNAREAMHLIELRTSPQGHPSYRHVGLEMHRLIREQAQHHLIADAMKFVGKGDVHLPRYQTEIGKEDKAE